VNLLGVEAPCLSNSPQTVTFEPHIISTKAVRFTFYCPAN
jgi:hypothetical protein